VKKAQEIGDSFDPTKELQRELAGKIRTHDRQTGIADADVPTLRRWIHSWTGASTTH
jgi:hypothetical protein